jgi:23S rRNA pseudouridine2605 synthase
MPQTAPQPHLIRLQRYLAACGLGSRRSCEEFIVAGRVTVDGQVVNELGAKVDPQRQEVALDGESLRMERKKYYAVNKPAGCVCTHRDPQGRPRVVDLLPPGGPRLFTVGRLDAGSEGLIIVTNDGDLAQKLAHPKYRIYRTYEVQVAGVPTRETLAELKRGLHFAEGKFRVHDVRLRKTRGQSALLEVVLAEGQNREVRRLFARIGHKVLTLKRTAFGPVRLGALGRGNIRELERDELAELVGIVHRNVSKPARKVRPASGRRQPAG